MKSHLLILALIGLSAPNLLPAAEVASPTGRVTVSYDAPDKFTDFKTDNLSNDRDVAYLCNIFTAHVEKLANRYLPPETHLELRFKDIDLAGDFEPRRDARANDIRLIKDIYPPRMTVEFRLLGPDGKVLAEGERKLIQLYYTSMNVQPLSDPLRFDKQLLTDWMSSEFRHLKS